MWVFSVCGICGSGLSQGQAVSLVAVQQTLSCRISATRLFFARLSSVRLSQLSLHSDSLLSPDVGASSLECLHVHIT